MAYRFPPLSTFRTFEAAARHLSFKVAAEELHVTPSAVSQQIRNLESYLGIALFERYPNGLQLSRSGLSLLRNVRDGLDCFAAGIESTRCAGNFSLNVVTPPAFATHWLVPRLTRFSDAYPEVTIRVTSDPATIDGFLPRGQVNAQMEMDPRQEHSEVIIRFGDGRYTGYRVEKLLTPEYVVACSRSLSEGASPLQRPEDARNHVLLHDESIPAVDKRPSWSEWFRRAGVQGVDAERGTRFSNGVLVHEAALEGHGLALVIRQHIETEVADGRLIMPFSLTLPSPYTYFLITPRTAARQSVIKAFSEWIHDEINSQRSRMN